jgi:transcriptional regulator of acetoin/glycerol metabolism
MKFPPFNRKSVANSPTATLLWDNDKAALGYLNISPEGLIIGRELLQHSFDDRLSRQHARVLWNRGKFEITDLGSRNGTHVAGNALVHRTAITDSNTVVRTGRTILLLTNPGHEVVTDDIATTDGLVIGPATSQAWNQLERAAKHRRHLLITGENGTGKTRYARALARRTGEPVAIFDPEVHAVSIDRLLGKATLLIVEQLHRLNDVHITSLAAVLGAKPELRLVCTTIATPDQLRLPAFLQSPRAMDTIAIPALRDRFDEIATMVVNAVNAAEPALAVHCTFIETCLLRAWPGNVFELMSEVTRCAQAVASQGKSTIRGEDLGTSAGQLMNGNPTLHLSAQRTIVALRSSRKNTDSDES